jgi:hypothetical protein
MPWSALELSMEAPPILVVEDDPAIRAVVTEALAGDSFRVVQPEIRKELRALAEAPTRQERGHDRIHQGTGPLGFATVLRHRGGVSNSGRLRGCQPAPTARPQI